MPHARPRQVLLTPFPGGLRPTGWMCYRLWLQTGPGAPTAAQRPPSVALGAKMSGTAAGEGRASNLGLGTPLLHQPQALQSSRSGRPYTCRECQVKHWEKHGKVCKLATQGDKAK